MNSELVDFEARWTAQGYDADGRLIHVVVVAHNLSIDVVTAIAK